MYVYAPKEVLEENRKNVRGVYTVFQLKWTTENSDLASMIYTKF